LKKEPECGNLVWERVVKDMPAYCRELFKTFEEK